MRILVCTDGSEQSHKALEAASLIAEGPNFNEVAIVHVDEGQPHHSFFPLGEGTITTDKEMEEFREWQKNYNEKRQKILSDALEIFEKKNITARTILKEGRAAEGILEAASEEGSAMIIIGSRGLSGLKKAFIGSVSNAVLQEAKNCSVVVVK